jgi:flagellar biosynthesis anti-sigma factor FlgM
MKIDAPLGFPEQVGPQGVTTTGFSPSQNQGERVGVSPDEVQFSVDGEKIQQLKANLDGLPDLRQDRVLTLRQAIEEGSYNVSSHQIAQAMSSELLDEVQQRL